MKNIFKISIVTLALLTSELGAANDKTTIISVKDNTTPITLDSVRKGELLSIKDNKGVIFYKEMIKESGAYNKQFELTHLPDGNYYFELDKGHYIKTIPFEVRNKEVKLNEKKTQTIYKYITNKIKSGS